MRESTAPSTLRRLLVLQQFSAFAGAELAELAMLADNVAETVFTAGQIIAPAEQPVSALHLILSGRVESGNGGTDVWGPRSVFGLLEVLARRRRTLPAIATVETRTLALGSGDAIEILEDNFGVLRAVLRGLAGQLVGLPDAALAPRRCRCVAVAGERLGLVERLIVLRQHVPFVRGQLQALAAVAHASDEVHWPAGAIVTRSGELADGMLVVLEGELAARTASGSSRTLVAGDQIGGLLTLAGLRHRETIEAITPVRALRTTGATILDVLEDHTELGLTMIGTFAGALLDAGEVQIN
ncbi:MAG TPA: cyclic nucleotide-binding domain-containing protein [Kofleriaceae bacterium]|nr:cyclic nucleotide-binding domain-containing protein [Kofleriaceae bacterium]